MKVDHGKDAKKEVQDAEAPGNADGTAVGKPEAREEAQFHSAQSQARKPLNNYHFIISNIAKMMQSYFDKDSCKENLHPRGS